MRPAQRTAGERLRHRVCAFRAETTQGVMFVSFRDEIDSMQTIVHPYGLRGRPSLYYGQAVGDAGI